MTTSGSIVYEQDQDSAATRCYTPFAQSLADDAKDAVAVAGNLCLISYLTGPLAAAIFTEIRAERARREEFTGRCDA